jgi:AraC-like DNA-binding protein
MTAIDDILDGLRMQSSVFCRMALHGAWGFAKGALPGAPFHLVLTGHAWLSLDGASATMLGPGDIAILPAGDAHQLLSQPGACAVPFQEVADERGLSPWQPGVRYKSINFRFGHGEQTTRLISGVFAFDDRRPHPLLASLPPLLISRADQAGEEGRVIASVAALLDAELLSGTPGAAIMSTRLSDILFIQVIRRHLREAAALPQGWLRGMSDARIAPALALMQRQPAKPWSVDSLAREIGMSRSRFASRFRDAVGQGPLEYLTHWRMHVAANMLTDGRSSLAQAAAAVGYRSEVSFSKAFKRWAGRTPGEFRRLPAHDDARSAVRSVRQDERSTLRDGLP